MQGHHHVEMVMGTAVSIDVRDGPAPQRAVAEVVEWFHHVDVTFSPYRDSSVITQLGRGELDLTDTSAEVREVLTLCDEVRVDSGGLFDIAIPAPNGTQLDPSGLVKGWSVAKALELLTAAGVFNACINAGGDVAVLGQAGEGAPWRVGVRHPERVDRLAVVLAGSGPFAVATSARYERGDHLFDPRTGRPAAGLASATVVGPDIMLVDAYATVLYVAGLDGLAWLERHPGYGGFAITDDQLTYSTATFDHYRA